MICLCYVNKSHSFFHPSSSQSFLSTLYGHIPGLMLGLGVCDLIDIVPVHLCIADRLVMWATVEVIYDILFFRASWVIADLICVYLIFDTILLLILLLSWYHYYILLFLIPFFFLSLVDELSKQATFQPYSRAIGFSRISWWFYGNTNWVSILQNVSLERTNVTLCNLWI